MQIIKVKHGKSAQYLDMPNFVYCARCLGGFEVSPLGNPFKVGRDGTLPEVLDKYEEWLRSAIKTVPAVQAAFSALTEDSILGCWCCNKPSAGDKPWSCHCDVIAYVYRSCGDMIFK